MDLYIATSVGTVVIVLLFGAGFLRQQGAMYKARLRDKDKEIYRLEQMLDVVMSRLMGIDFAPLHERSSVDKTSSLPSEFTPLTDDDIYIGADHGPVE